MRGGISSHDAGVESGPRPQVIVLLVYFDGIGDLPVVDLVHDRGDILPGIYFFFALRMTLCGHEC